MRYPWFQLVWRHPVVHLPPCIRPLLVPATDGYPRGFKGAALLQLWLDHRDQAPGFVVVDGDTALDPRTVVALEDAADADPGCVWTVACRLWGYSAEIPEEGAVEEVSRAELEAVLADPGVGWRAKDNPDWRWEDGRVYSWRRPSGVLAHRVYEGGRARWGRPDDDRVDLFGFGCTYLPNRLLEAVDRAGRWGELYFPQDDLVLSHIAQEAGVPARLVPGVEVVHLHWSAYDVDRLSAPKPAAEREAVAR